jgi:hypothetical protein
MDTRERNLKLFNSPIPRLFPNVDYHRPIIEGLLAQLAATESERYAERLEKYNALADKQGVPRFGRVLVVKEEAPPTVTVPVATGPSADPISIEPVTVPVEPPPKKVKKTKPVPHSVNA